MVFADFGLSIDITQERPVTRVGTLDYMAPEVVVCPDKSLPGDNKEKEHLHYNNLVDAWAVGVLAYELIVGRAPFACNNLDASQKHLHKRATIQQILRAQPRFPAWITEPARHFITWALTKDVPKRPSIPQLSLHPWITSHAKMPPKIQPGRAHSFHNLKMWSVPAGENGANDNAGVGRALASHSPPCPKLGAVPEDPWPGCGQTSGSQISSGQTSSGQTSGGEFSGSQTSECNASSEDMAITPGSITVSPFATTTNVDQGEQHPYKSGVVRGDEGSINPQLAGSGGGGSGVFGMPTDQAAAERLRAFVQRCSSVNNIDGLRAVAMQPAEPCQGCFEPGGRFFTPPPKAQQHQPLMQQEYRTLQHQPYPNQQQQQQLRVVQESVLSCVGGVDSTTLADRTQHPKNGMTGMYRAHASGSILGGVNTTSGASPPHMHACLSPDKLAHARPPPMQLVRMPSSSTTLHSSATNMNRSDSCKSLQQYHHGGSCAAAIDGITHKHPKLTDLSHDHLTSPQPMAMSPLGPPGDMKRFGGYFGSTSSSTERGSSSSQEEAGVKPGRRLCDSPSSMSAVSWTSVMSDVNGVTAAGAGGSSTTYHMSPSQGCTDGLYGSSTAGSSGSSQRQQQQHRCPATLEGINDEKCMSSNWGVHSAHYIDLDNGRAPDASSPAVTMNVSAPQHNHPQQRNYPLGAESSPFSHQEHVKVVPFFQTPRASNSDHTPHPLQPPTPVSPPRAPCKVPSCSSLDPRGHILGGGAPEATISPPRCDILYHAAAGAIYPMRPNYQRSQSISLPVSAFEGNDGKEQEGVCQNHTFHSGGNAVPGLGVVGNGLSCFAFLKGNRR